MYPRRKQVVALMMKESDSAFTTVLATELGMVSDATW
jgi:hypothetical protein